jgi:hypothetical protein
MNLEHEYSATIYFPHIAGKADKTVIKQTKHISDLVNTSILADKLSWCYLPSTAEYVASCNNSPFRTSNSGQYFVQKLWVSSHKKLQTQKSEAEQHPTLSTSHIPVIVLDHGLISTDPLITYSAFS